MQRCQEGPLMSRKAQLWPWKVIKHWKGTALCQVPLNPGSYPRISCISVSLQRNSFHLFVVLGVPAACLWRNAQASAPLCFTGVVPGFYQYTSDVPWQWSEWWRLAKQSFWTHGCDRLSETVSKLEHLDTAVAALLKASALGATLRERLKAGVINPPDGTVHILSSLVLIDQFYHVIRSSHSR